MLICLSAVNIHWRKFDRLVQCGVHEALLHSQVKGHTNVDISSVEKYNSVFTIKCKDKRKFEGYDCVIYAVGRGPFSTELGLNHTTVQQDERGFIISDEWEETHQKGVYALGDINNKVMLTPVAIRAGRKWADRVFGGVKDAKMDYNFVPSVIFSHPPIGTIGLTEETVRQSAQNKKLPGPIKIFESHFRNIKYGMYANSDEKIMSHMKLVCVGKEEKVVGLHMIGDGSDEILQGFAVAMKMGATKKDFDNVTAIHPTASEELVTMKIPRGEEDNYPYNCGTKNKI